MNAEQEKDSKDADLDERFSLLYHLMHAAILKEVDALGLYDDIVRVEVQVIRPAAVNEIKPKMDIGVAPFDDTVIN